MKNSKPGTCPQVKSCKTGSLPEVNVGAGTGSKPPGIGPNKTHGSYSSGKAPGTRIAK